MKIFADYSVWLPPLYYVDSFYTSLRAELMRRHFTEMEKVRGRYRLWS
jgi:hypothetical protein